MWYVFRAWYDTYVYYGYTKDVKNRREQFIRNYSIKNYKSNSVYSYDMLTDVAKKIGVSPSKWRFQTIYEFPDKESALSFKAECVRNNPYSINYVYKHTVKTRKRRSKNGE